MFGVLTVVCTVALVTFAVSGAMALRKADACESATVGSRKKSVSRAGKSPAPVGRALGVWPTLALASFAVFIISGAAFLIMRL